MNFKFNIELTSIEYFAERYKWLIISHIKKVEGHNSEICIVL